MDYSYIEVALMFKQMHGLINSPQKCMICLKKRAYVAFSYDHSHSYPTPRCYLCHQKVCRYVASAINKQEMVWDKWPKIEHPTPSFTGPVIIKHATVA